MTATIEIGTLQELAAQLRVDSILTSTSAGSRHPTSSMSAGITAPHIVPPAGRLLRESA